MYDTSKEQYIKSITRKEKNRSSHNIEIFALKKGASEIPFISPLRVEVDGIEIISYGQNITDISIATIEAQTWIVQNQDTFDTYYDLAIKVCANLVQLMFTTDRDTKTKLLNMAIWHSDRVISEILKQKGEVFEIWLGKIADCVVRENENNPVSFLESKQPPSDVRNIELE